MSNYSNELGQIHFCVNIYQLDSIKAGLLEIFSNDLDFITNEEYFRKNTLKKGYDNEAERIVVEYMNDHKITNEKKLNKAVSYMVKKVFDNSDYSTFKSDVLNIDDSFYSIAISYIY